MEALWIIWQGIPSSLARNAKSVWVVAPYGSPTTRSAISASLEPDNISWAPSSTRVRSAIRIGRP